MSSLLDALDDENLFGPHFRGTEWAATGDVTIPIPDDFPTADATSSRKSAK